METTRPVAYPTIGGLTWIVGRAPTHVTPKCQPFSDKKASRCSRFARNRARPRKCLAGEGSSSEGRRQEQNLLWRDPTIRWNNKEHTKIFYSPDLRRKGEVLWLNNFYEPAWGDEQLAVLDMQMTLPDNPDNGRPAGYEMGGTALNLNTICRQGRLAEAVEALEVLVQTGCPISKSLVYTVLKQCVAKKDLALGRRVHALTVKMGYESDTFLCNHILRMYASHARLEEAMDVFTLVAKPDAFMWSSIISAHVKHGQARQAIQLYQQMRCSSVKPDGHVFIAALQACARGADLETGQQVHADVLASGIEPELFVVNCLVHMYAKCGSLEGAQRVFDGLRQKDVVTWTAMVAGYAQEGMGHEALRLYSGMQQEGITAPDSVTFVCLLQACASVGTPALEMGQQIHAEIEEQGLQADVVIGASLVNMYAKCGSLDDARRVFDRLRHKTVVTWTAMIAGFSKQGMGQEALHLYSAMQEERIAAPNSVTFVCLLQACASVGTLALEKGKQFHAQIREQGLEADLGVGGSLVNMYAKCGSLDDAQSVFDRLPQKDVVTWTAIIAGYSHQGMGQEALQVYSAMQEKGMAAPDSVTFACLLQACASVGTQALEKGKQLHGQIEKRGLQADVVVANSLVNMYAKCGSLENAQSVFRSLPHKDVVTWNAIIAGFSQRGMGEEALHLYSAMQEEGIAMPDSVTFVCVLQACASVGTVALEKGKQLHAEVKEQGLQADVVVGGSLVNMYAKCGSVEDAQSVFDMLCQKNVVTWNAMIAGYSQQGMCQEALRLYAAMLQKGMTAPDSVTFVCLLQACASVAALDLGRQLHAQIEVKGLQAAVFVANSLINMYSKCGSMTDAQQVFDALSERDIVSWNALIAGYSRQGHSEVVFDLLHRMGDDCLQPNDGTFLSVLSVCSHVGLVNKGREYFEAMSKQYGITPSVEHYTCMVDLLGRKGQLDEALEVVRTMPVNPNNVVWRTVLGACRKWRNVEVGRYAFDEAVKLDEKDSAAYVMMSNIYTGAQMWEEAQKIKASRTKIGAWKTPGQSWWTDLSGAVHTFLVGDKHHPESDGIYARLEQLVPKMKKEGYVPHLESSLRGTSDVEKEVLLCGHSEKLAIAYALNKTPEGTTIRIVKNLRVCDDCHTATAYISKIEKRTIICRDANRFHVYREGSCSCGDYW